MIIYNSTGIKKIEFEPDSSSQHSNGVMTDNVVTLSFIHFKSIALEVNDYILFNNEKFILSEPYTPIHKNNQQYSYESVKFYGTIGDCRKALVLKMVNDSSESVFSLTAPLFDHLKLVVDNINRVKNSISWVVGAVSNNSKNETITYDGTYCIDALGKIAETFETEWWVEGYSINATKAEFGTAIELGYGKGLLGLARDANKEARFFTRLYPVGSMRNIDRTKYGHDRLQLPAGVKYVDRNIELGVIEASEEAAFAHIYPKRIGVVSESRSAPVKIDGADSIIYYFKDDKLNFDPSEYIIADQTMKIVFQSGELNGYEFEVNYKDGEFEIINQYPSPDIQLPGGTFVPKIGDEYILYNIVMPDEYYTLAENEYKQATNEYLKKYSEDVSIYKGQTDYVYLGEKELILKVGQRVKLLSNYFENGYRDSRIIKITRKLNNRLAMDLEISNSVGKTRLETVEGSVANIQTLFKEQINKNELHILRSWDSSDPSDYNVFSALRSLKVFAKLVGGNFFRGVQRFYDGLQSSDFVTGLTGKGWAILNRFGKSHIEADSLTLREFLEVPELRFNRVDVVSGELWNAIAFGTIERVDTENKIATVKLLEGELLSSHVNDICRGIFYSLDGAVEDIDSNGFGQMQGFGTAYFTPTELLADGKSFRYELQNGTTFHPCKAMKFVSYGNFSDKTRQASAYSTRTYTRYLSGVNTWSINPDKHIVAQFGDIEGLTIGGVTMRGTGSFQKNMYMTGVHIQFTPEELEDLRGQDAYNVSLSSYEGVIKVAGDGTIPTMLTEKNVITGELNVISGNENVITKTFILSTRIQAFKGASELFYALTPSTGAYSITLSPINCDAVVSGGVLSVTSIEDITNAYVDLQVNCEGNAVFTKRYAVFGVSDGQDGADGTSAYVIDLDNETDSVSCDHDGVVLNPENLPTTNITVYCGSQIDTAWIFSGVFHGCKGVIRGNHVQLTELTSDKATVDITATKSGISDLKTVFTVSKIKGGADGTPATRYWLLPSVNVIKCNSSGVNSPGAIQCRKCKQVGDGPIHYESGETYSDMRLYYSIDGENEVNFPSSNNEIYIHSVKQFIDFILKDAKTGNVLDSERIPVVKDGGDGRPGGDGTDGHPGSDGVVYSLLSSISQIRRNSLGSHEPGQFTVSFYQRVGSHAQTLYRAYIYVYGSNNGVDWTELGTVTTTANNRTITVSSKYHHYVIKTRSTLDRNFNGECLASISVNVVEDGASGENVASGAMPRNCGKYDNTKSYLYNKDFRDCSWIDEDGTTAMYQVAVFGTQLKGSVPSPTNTDWMKGNKETFTAIDTALIEGANIARFMFKEGKMQSQAVTTINGVEESVLSLDGDTGEFICNSGTFRGYTATDFHDTIDEFEQNEGGVKVYKIKDYLNVSVDGSDNGVFIPIVVLPSDRKYIGSIINIVDTVYAPWSRASLQYSTCIIADPRVGFINYIGGTYIGSSDDATNHRDSTAIQIRGAVVQLIGLPRGDYVYWCILNYKQSMESVASVTTSSEETRILYVDGTEVCQKSASTGKNTGFVLKKGQSQKRTKYTVNYYGVGDYVCYSEWINNGDPIMYVVRMNIQMCPVN